MNSDLLRKIVVGVWLLGVSFLLCLSLGQAGKGDAMVEEAALRQTLLAAAGSDFRLY